MKKMSKLFMVSAAILAVLVIACGDLDDQSPILIVSVDTTAFVGVVTPTEPLCMAYFSNDDWTGQYFQVCHTSASFCDPVVVVPAVYVVVFHDEDGDGQLSTGDPARGSADINPPAAGPPDTLQAITFVPLETRFITINLDSTIEY